MKLIKGVGYGIGNINTFSTSKAAKQVQTKAWTNRHKKHLFSAKERLTTHGANVKAIIRGVLINAFGFNIGDQVLEKLNDEALAKIRKNIIFHI